MNIKKRFPRSKAVTALLISSLFLILIKLFLIQVFQSDYLSKKANEQHNLFLELEPARGIIFDRNLRSLSSNLPVESLYAVPDEIENKDKIIKQLSNLLGLSKSYLKDRLNRKKSFIWLARKLSESKASKIKDLKIKGLNFIKENKRFYPNGYMASHIIGFTGIDNHGLEGIELYYNDYLEGKSGRCLLLRDAQQRKISLAKYFFPPQDGYDLVLTIDETIQFVAERELERAFRRYKAKAAMIIVMNPKTGEILALANRPTFDLNSYSDYQTDYRRNRAISDFFEPGSVFKIVTASAALEENMVSEEDRFYCEEGKYRVANHILHDHKPHGWLSFREVIVQSSNIGTTKVAQILGPEIVYRYMKLFGFGALTQIDLPGEVSGLVKRPSDWSGTSIGAIPIGQEVAVTTLQLVCAISSIANNGLYVKPFIVKCMRDKKGELIKEFHSTVIKRVISKDTAERIKDILTRVVEEGTGRRSRIEGLKVAGKTGTAQKFIDGRYSHNKFFASFVGFAPVDDPVIAVAVVVDEPRGSDYGGTVSAPIFKNVIENSLKYLETSKQIDFEVSQLDHR